MALHSRHQKPVHDRSAAALEPAEPKPQA